MVRCLTCNQPLPEGKEHPAYLGQSGRDLPEDDLSRWLDDLHKLLSYSGALFNALYQLEFANPECYLGGANDDTVERLTGLGWELNRVIRCHINGLSRAGEIWEARAKAATANSQKPHRKEDY